LATAPIAYWPLWEGAGAVAYDISGNARNGAYTGVDLGQVGIGDGRACPWFDGTGDYVNIYSAAFAADLDGAEGSAMVWPRVNSAGAWIDGATRDVLTLAADGNNYIKLRKSAVNNTAFWEYKAGGVSKSVSVITSILPYACWVLTWSAAGDEVRAYLNGVQQGTTQTTLGIWAGPLAPTFCTIGAASTVPAAVFHGWEAHAAVWNRALPLAEVASLARAA
jgi:hypothetical protein